MPDGRLHSSYPEADHKIGFFSSVRFVLISIVLLLGLVQLANSGARAFDAWKVYRSALQAETAEETFHTLMNALGALDFERSRTAIVLRNAKPISERDRAFIDHNRTVLGGMRNRIELDKRKLFTSPLSISVGKLCDQLSELREEVDRNVAVPLAERDPNILLKWSSATARLHGLIETELLQLMERQLSLDTDSILAVSRMQMLRFNGAQLRKAAVGASTRIHMAVRSGKPINIDVLRQISEYRGKSEALWMFMAQQAKVIDHPEVSRLMGQIKTKLVDALFPLQDELLKEARIGDYHVNEQEYLSVAMPTFKALSETMEAVVGISRDLAEQNKQLALQSLAGHAMLMVGGLVLIILAIAFVLFRLVRPLEDMSRLVNLFRQGQFNTVFPVAEREDEIGRLGEGLEEFRTTLIEREQMFHDLETAKSDAERANRAKSEFLSSMSHELRTPLNAILGFSQLLQYDPKEPLSEQQNDHVATVITAAEHLLDLINQILDLAKIEAGHVNLVLENVCVKDLIEGCVGLSATQAEQNGIALHTELPDAALGWSIHADATRARQILLNLISNAIKYNRKDGAVRVLAERGDGQAVKVVVADTGRGIPEEQHPHMFEVFNRLGAENTATEGTGIGLVVTKQLVEAMGGEIGFTSVEGEGSTFWVTFPLRSSD